MIFIVLDLPVYMETLCFAEEVDEVPIELTHRKCHFDRVCIDILT